MKMAKIINIKEFKFSQISKDEKRRKADKENNCLHKQLILHEDGEYIICESCGVQVSGYWALKKIINSLQDAWDDLKGARKIHNEQCKEKRFLKILNILDKAWRGKRQMAVGCPHCKAAILPEDNLGRLQYSAILERKRRDKVLR
jgi:ribosomal protein S27E